MSGEEYRRQLWTWIVVSLLVFGVGPALFVLLSATGFEVGFLAPLSPFPVFVAAYLAFRRGLFQFRSPAEVIERQNSAGMQPRILVRLFGTGVVRAGGVFLVAVAVILFVLGTILLYGFVVRPLF